VAVVRFSGRGIPPSKRIDAETPGQSSGTGDGEGKVGGSKKPMSLLFPTSVFGGIQL
jgi:hypothetical protein